jgi:hypothetical protein
MTSQKVRMLKLRRIIPWLSPVELFTQPLFLAHF